MATNRRPSARVLTLAVALVVLSGVALWLNRPDAPGEPILPESQPVAAQLIDQQYPGPGLVALKQWYPTSDYTLICENWDRLLPMRRSDLWVVATVPESGRVLISVSASTSNSHTGRADTWGIMVGDEVLAEAEVGVGDTRHRVTARFVLEDLPAGEVLRFDVAHRSERGGKARLHMGPTYGPVVIEVWSA